MIELKNVEKYYGYQKVLSHINMDLDRTGMIGIVGPSGCGKSTLLSIIGGLDELYIGRIECNGKKMSSTKLRKHSSFLFQELHIINWLSLKKNIQLAQFFKKTYKPHQEDQLDFHNKASVLSRGQKQRLAGVRARLSGGRVLLCDEPTGSLDHENAKRMMEALSLEAKRRLVVVVSHDEKLLRTFAHKIYSMKDGEIIKVEEIKDAQVVTQKRKEIKPKPFSCLSLIISSLSSHKKQVMKMIVSLILCLMCLLVTFQMTNEFEGLIQNYIHSIMPSSTIRFRRLDQTAFLLEDIHFNQEDTRTRLSGYKYQVECVGLSTDDESDSIVYIGDESSPYQHLMIREGRSPQSPYEIMVSKETYKRLFGNDSFYERSVFGHYEVNQEKRTVSYQLVGIVESTSLLDTIYQYPNNYIDILSLDSHVDYGLIYYQTINDNVLNQLRIDNQLYEFDIVGESTQIHFESIMKNIKIILYIFSSFSILSAALLMGECSFLSVLTKKKDYAIMNCFGASRLKTCCLQLFESILIYSTAFIFSILFYIGFQFSFNRIINELLELENFTLSLQMELVLCLYGIGAFIVIITELPPLIYVLSQNTSSALK